MKTIDRAKQIYDNPEKFGIAGNIDVIRNTISTMFPEKVFGSNDNDKMESVIKHLEKMSDNSGKLNEIIGWLRSLRFPTNSEETNKIINKAIKACRLYGIFHKGMGEVIAFLKNIQVSEAKNYLELYNSFTDNERKMVDDYYKNLFDEKYVYMTDEDREIIEKGANLLLNFKHEDAYNKLSKFFKKK